MNTRTLGRTGLSVTELGYGAMELRNMDESQAGRLLNAVLDAGINLIDTAPDYGLSEELIGKTIAYRRDEYTLASKCGCNIPREEGDDLAHIWTADQVFHNIDLSLQRLKTDRLDLLQAHSGTADEIGEDVVDAMKRVKEQGKVRFIGYTATGQRRFGIEDFPEMLSWDVFDFYQLPYCIVARTHEHTITELKQKDLGVILRGTVKPWYCRVYDNEGEWEVFWEKANLDELLAHGEDRYRFMLRYAITHPDYSTTIIGTKNLDHLQANIDTFEIGPLQADTYSEAKGRLDGIGVTVA